MQRLKLERSKELLIRTEANSCGQLSSGAALRQRSDAPHPKSAATLRFAN
jgi:hypothetical protein